MTCPTNDTVSSSDMTAPTPNVTVASDLQRQSRRQVGVATGALLVLGSFLMFAIVKSGRLDSLNIVMLVVVFAAVAFLVSHNSWRFLRGPLRESARKRRHDDDREDDMVDITERINQALLVPAPPPYSGGPAPVQELVLGTLGRSGNVAEPA